MIRQDILNALRSDFLTITTENGYNNFISKAHKRYKELENMSDTDFDSVFIGFGTAVNNKDGEANSIWDVPVMSVVYFKTNTDLDNEGLLETKAESLIEDVENLVFNNTQILDSVISLDLLTITPYITIQENVGFLMIEYKLTYIGV